MKPFKTQLKPASIAALLAIGAMTGMGFSAPAQQAPIHGMIGVGTWETQAEFKDIKVTKGGRTLYSSNFAKGLQGWKTSRGKWAVSHGVLRQTGMEADVRAITGDPRWSDYIMTLKARKTGGKEGFLVIFGASGKPDKNWWSVGGWGNTKNAIELPGLPLKQLKGHVVTGRWYNVRIELKGQKVKCYLDNKLMQQKA